MSFLQFLTSVTLLVRICPSHHWKGKTSQGVFGAGCFCNILIFQVDVFQIHFLFSWGGQESHKAHYYFSRTWKTITMLIKRARGKAWLQSRKTKDRKSRWTDTTYCGGNWEVITAAVNPRAGDFETIASYLAFPFIKATYIRTFGQNIKTIKRENKAGATYKNFSCVTITPERTAIMGDFYLKVFCLHVTCGKTVSGRGSGWLQGNSIWGAQ